MGEVSFLPPNISVKTLNGMHSSYLNHGTSLVLSSIPTPGGRNIAAFMLVSDSSATRSLQINQKNSLSFLHLIGINSDLYC